MKKAHVFFAIMFACLGITRAQYFQHRYASYGLIGNGFVTKATGPGHVMAGSMGNAFVPFYGFTVVRTDAGGHFSSATDFNNSYELYDANGYKLWINSAKVVEYTDASGYGVLGGFVSYDADQNPTYGIYYVYLDVNGNVINTMAYTVVSPFISTSIASAIEAISAPGDIFATGTVRLSGQEKNYTWILRIDHGGNLQWGNIYSFDAVAIMPNDIIESPYDKDVIVVGGVEKTYGDRDGFWLSVQPGSGGVLATNYYDLADESISAINVSSNPASTGFVLCGTTTYIKGVNSFWVFSADSKGTGIYWSYIYDDVHATLTCHGSAEVVEYYSKTAGIYEYYVTGGSGSVGVSDVMTIRLDANGIGMPGGLYLYDLGNNEAAVNVSINETGTGDGISEYVYDQNSTLLYMTIIKSDFNGVSGCNERFLDPSTTDAPVKIGGDKVDIIDKLQPYKITKGPQIKNDDIELCYKDAMKNGMATGISEAGAARSSFVVYPNPVNDQLTIKGNGMTQIEVFNVLGEKVAEIKDRDLSEKNVSTIHWEKGVYRVRITERDGTAHIFNIMK